MSKYEPSGHDIFLFDDWVVHEYRRTGGFTALIILVAIGNLTVVPLRSTFVHVIGDELLRVGMTPVAIALARGFGVYAAACRQEFEKGRSFATIESAKWVGAVRAAFDGRVVTINETLISRPDDCQFRLLWGRLDDAGASGLARLGEWLGHRCGGRPGL